MYLESVIYVAKFGSYNVAHVQSKPGSFSHGGSYDTLCNVLQILKPRLVFSIGIAFGINPDKLKIGDVMVADYIIPYDKNTVRNGKLTVKNPWFPKTSSYLSNRLCSLSTSFSEFSVVTGGMITGESVVDDAEYKAKIVAPSSAYDVIGGEMEAYGVYKCANENSLLCITTKGVCDYAEGKNNLSDDINENELIKDSIQLFAMENVCLVFKKLFEDKHSFSDLALVKSQPWPPT